MKRLDWFDRQFKFGYPPPMLPFFLARLEGTIVRLGKKIAGESETILNWQPEGKWSIKQHIGHLAEVDAIALRRIAEILTGISPMSSAVFELAQDYNEQPVSPLLEHFRKQRIQNLKAYESVTETDCLKSSLHPRLKIPMTLVDLAFFDAEHDDHHLVRINEIKGTGGC
jgi:hypothetical protein